MNSISNLNHALAKVKFNCHFILRLSHNLTLITDTNILFDVIKIGALHDFFSFDSDICTTVFVIDEIKSSPQRVQIETFIRSKQLISPVKAF